MCAGCGTASEHITAVGFPHESLDCYRLAVGVARWTAAAWFPAKHGDLHDQALRAAQSVTLKLAEGWGHAGAAVLQTGL